MRRSALIAGVVGIVALSASSLAAPESSGTDRGFVVTSFYYANNDGGAEACPDGMTVSSREMYLANLPPAERAEMSKPDKINSLYGISIRSKDGKNLCSNPTLVPDPHMHTVQGGTAFGVNLDGTQDGHDTANSCAHEKFSNPSGMPAIDNQFYRVMGCVPGYRPKGIDEQYKSAAYRSGEYTVLINVMGLKPGRSDGDVKVGIYSSANPAPFAASGTPIANASLTVHPNPHFRAVANGHIADGILTTDPVDLSLYHTVGRPSEIALKGARLRLELLPDGRAKGLLAGYQDVEFLYRHQFDLGSPEASDQTRLIVAGAAAAESNYDCPSVMYALKRLADGYPDKTSGQCTAISSVFRIEAVPVFVIPPSADESGSVKTAAAETGLVGRWLRKLGL